MRLSLHEATLADMPFRAKLMSDPATMSYNAPYFPPDGCIPFPEEKWQDWLNNWTGHEPERFVGFLTDEQDNLVGEVSWHDFGREMGIVIAHDQRGKGCGTEGLRLLVERAFRHVEITELRNTFEPDREPALTTHINAGFVPIGKDGECIVLRLTRERREEKRRTAWLRDVFDAMCLYEQGEPHRIHHFIKVHGFARQIALREGLDDQMLFTLEVAALTHDIGIKPAMAQYGRADGALQERLGPPEAESMLSALGLPVPVIRRVSFLIAHHHTTQNVAGKDWQILLEADFLVNMIEEHCTQESIDNYRKNVFRTAEGLRLLEQVRPARAGETNAPQKI